MIEIQIEVSPERSRVAALPRRPRPCDCCLDGVALIVNGGRCSCSACWAARCERIENPCDCAGCRVKLFGGYAVRYAVAPGVPPYVEEPNARYFDEVHGGRRKSARRAVERSGSSESGDL